MVIVCILFIIRPRAGRKTSALVRKEKGSAAAPPWGLSPNSPVRTFACSLVTACRCFKLVATCRRLEFVAAYRRFQLVTVSTDRCLVQADSAALIGVATDLTRPAAG